MSLSTTVILTRSLLFIANIILVMLGLFILVTGLWIVFDPLHFHMVVIQDIKEEVKKKIEEFASDFTQEGGRFWGPFLTAIGLVMIFVSGSGCLGAKRESRNLLWIYSAMMTLVLVSEIVLLVCLTKYQQNMKTFLAKPVEYHTKYMEKMLAMIDTKYYQDLNISGVKYQTVIDDILLQAKGSSDVGEMVIYILKFSSGFTFILLLLGLINVVIIANYFERFIGTSLNTYSTVPMVETVSPNV